MKIENGRTEELKDEGTKIKFLVFVFFSSLVLWFLGLSGVVFAEEITLTLDEAIEIALRDNRDILLKIEDVKKSKAEIAEARGALFPTLNFTAGRTVTRSLYPKNTYQSTTQTTLKQYLYKGGKTVNTIKQKEYEKAVSSALLEKARLETALSVEKAFYTLLLAKEFADLNKGILDNAKEHLDFITARFQNGQASESDILTIKESLSSVGQACQASVNQVESGQVLLRSLLYLDEAVTIKPEGEFSCQPQELAYDEAFLKAMSLRPEIRQYEAQANADKRAIEIAKADNRPSVYASWDYYNRSTTSLTFSPSRNWNDYNVIGITFSWPIFDGWTTKAKMEQAIVDLKTTRLNSQKAVRDIISELKESYLDLKNAIAKISAAAADAELYNNTLLVTQDKYKAGIASLLDLKDISLGYEISLFNQKQAVYDYIIAKARFEKAMGG